MLGSRVGRGMMAMGWVVGLGLAWGPGASCAGEGAKVKPGGPSVDLQTVYLASPVEFVLKSDVGPPGKLAVRRIRLRGKIDGEGELSLDPNPCTVGPFGDAEPGAQGRVLTLKVRIVRLRLADPAGKKRWCCEIAGDRLESPRVGLVWPGGGQGWPRLVLGDRQRQVITLESEGRLPGMVEDYPCGLAEVPEMMSLPEEKCWSSCDPNAFPEEVAAAAADWRKKSAWVQGHLTPELARGLSRWAHEQMASYQQVPDVAGAKWKPVAADKTHLLLEAIVDTLPVHSPLVTRWLVLFVSYDRSTKSIDRVTITIRGQVLE